MANALHIHALRWPRRTSTHIKPQCAERRSRVNSRTQWRRSGAGDWHFSVHFEGLVLIVTISHSKPDTKHVQNKCLCLRLTGKNVIRALFEIFALRLGFAEMTTRTTRTTRTDEM